MSKEITSHILIVFLLMGFVLSGCIRLTGSAGYTKFGGAEGTPKTKQVGFDTNDILYPNQAKGSIDIGESE